MSKIFSAIVAVLMMVGVTAACVDFGQSISYGFSAGTTGATYSEGGSFSMGSEDFMKMGSVFAFESSGSMFGQTEITVKDNGADNAYANVYQDMFYTKSIEHYVDPHMSNRVSMGIGDMQITTFMGSKLTGVQMGMDAKMTGAVGSSFSFYGYTTDAAFNPIATGYMNARNFHGIVEAKDKFTFDRTTQLNSAVFGFNSTL
jgi:hypothetical protein